MKKEIWEKDYNKRINDCYSTQGYQKLWAYFNEIVKKEYVQSKFRELRKKYDIPKDGFKNGYYGNPPREWAFNLDETARNDISNVTEDICSKFKLHYLDWYEILEYYLFFNKIEQIYHTNSYNLCLVQDLVEEKREYELEKQEGCYTGTIEKSDDEAFPIAVRISPYASQRDIVDYIKRMYPTIKEAQQKYIDKDVKIGKIKVKNQQIQERNDFIYCNRDKPTKEIRKLLSDKNIFLDDGHILKIISLEKQKRKEV